MQNEKNMAVPARKNLVVYIHGAGGSAAEAEHVKSLFPESEVLGLDYRAQTPWEAIEEFHPFFAERATEYDSRILIANSIGAFFALHALPSVPFEKVYFISPVVDMEKLITDMLQWAGVTEKELEEKGTIHTAFGQDLSWAYLTWVRTHPVVWQHPTAILYGSRDDLQSIDTIQAFAKKCGAAVTVMEGGEHWFHTEEQMAFLDRFLLT